MDLFDAVMWALIYVKTPMKLSPRLTLLLLDRILFRGMVLVETRDLFADEACDKDHTPRNGDCGTPDFVSSLF